MPVVVKEENKVTAGSKIADKSKMRNGKAKMGERIENLGNTNAIGEQPPVNLTLVSSASLNQ